MNMIIYGRIKNNKLKTTEVRYNFLISLALMV